MLPLTLPKKYGAVILPVDAIVPRLVMLPEIILPLTLKLVSMPTEVMLGCAFVVTVPANVAALAFRAYVALATVPVTLPPVMLDKALPLPMK